MKDYFIRHEMGIQTNCSYLAPAIITSNRMTTVIQACQQLSYLVMRRIRSHKLRKRNNRLVCA